MNPSKLILIMIFIFSNLCNDDIVTNDIVTIDISGLKKKAGTSLGLGCPLKKFDVANNPYAKNNKPVAIDQFSSNQNHHLKKEPLVLQRDIKNAQNKQKFYNIYDVEKHEQGLVPKSNQPSGNFKRWEPKIDQINFNNPLLNILNENKVGQNKLTVKKPINEENKLSDVGINAKYPDDLFLGGKNSQTGLKYPFEENTGKPKTDQKGKFMMPYGNPFGYINPMFMLKPYNNFYKNLNIAKLSGVQENQSVNQNKPLNDHTAVRKISELAKDEMEALVKTKQEIEDPLLKADEKGANVKVFSEIDPLSESDFDSFKPMVVTHELFENYVKTPSHLNSDIIVPLILNSDIQTPSHRIIDLKKSQDPSEGLQSGLFDEIDSRMNSFLDISKISGHDSLDKKTGWNGNSIYQDDLSKEEYNGSAEYHNEDEFQAIPSFSENSRDNNNINDQSIDSEIEIDNNEDEVQGKFGFGENSEEDNNMNEESFDSEIEIENNKQITPITDLRKSQSQLIFSSPEKLENIEVKTQISKDDGLVDYRSIFLDLEDDSEDPKEVWQRDFIKRSQVPRVSVKYGLTNFSLAQSFLRNTLRKPIRKIKKVYLFEILKCRDCLRDRFLNAFIANGFVGPRMSKF